VLRRRPIGIAAFVGFIATIFAANWLIEHVGIIDIGFGLMAPAGVLAVGLAFTFRDVIQRTLGVKWTIAGILIGATLSYAVSPAFALASGAAFLLSELADLVVYTPLQERSWIGAVVLSNTVGLVVDSMLFLAIAFGSQEFLAGQVVGKVWMTALAIPALLVIRPRLRTA
jgi:queuosine precursor transporter